MQGSCEYRENNALLQYHLRECAERYKALESRLARLEAALWMAVVGMLGTATTVIVEMVSQQMH